MNEKDETLSLIESSPLLHPPSNFLSCISFLEIKSKPLSSFKEDSPSRLKQHFLQEASLSYSSNM
jgi:hypothetical protein